MAVLLSVNNPLPSGVDMGAVMRLIERYRFEERANLWWVTIKGFVGSEALLPHVSRAHPVIEVVLSASNGQILGHYVLHGSPVQISAFPLVRL